MVAGRAAASRLVLSRTVWDRPRYALRDERYKFIYDTRTGESSSTTSWPIRGRRRTWPRSEPLRAAYYRESLHYWMKSLVRSATGGGEEARLTPEQCANLRALGYVSAECPP